jgi:hypothetical protein
MSRKISIVQLRISVLQEVIFTLTQTYLGTVRYVEHNSLLNLESHTLHKYILINLTFRGPCILVYSYNKSQRDALFIKFILIKNSRYFGHIYCPSSGVLTLYTQQ